MSRWTMTLAAVMLIACGGNKDDEDSATLITDTAIGGPVPTDAPVVRNCESVCRRVGLEGAADFQWQFSCSFEDPQGNETVNTLGDVLVTKGGETVANLRAVCGNFDVGWFCQEDYAEDSVGVTSCRDAEAFDFTLTVYDIDGNSGSGSAQGRASG